MLDVEIKDSILFFKGKITIYTVHKFLHSFFNAIDSRSIDQIDLSGIQTCDSSLLLLLIELYKKNRAIFFVQASSRLRDLAAITQLEHFLPFR